MGKFGFIHQDKGSLLFSDKFGLDLRMGHDFFLTNLRPVMTFFGLDLRQARVIISKREFMTS